MNIQLFIDGQLCDIGQKDDFARNFKMTKQFSDLENPSKIVTDYSYSISLPGTDTNRSIFGYIESGTDPYSFNPNERHPYILNVNGVKFSEGSCQLTEISVQSGQIDFKCSFYSNVHKVVMDLSNKPLKDLSVFDPSDGYYHYLDREAMMHFWFGDHQYADMIRYVPCRAGKYPNFNSSKMLVSSGGTITGMDLGTDYDEYAMREYRVQYQRPAISVDKIMDGLKADFNVDIDSSIEGSPYITQSWLMCPQMSQDDKSEDCTGTFSTFTVTVGASSSSSSDNITNMSQTSALSSGDQVFTYYTVNPEENCFGCSIECCLQIDCSAKGNPQYGIGGLNYNADTIWYRRYENTRPDVLIQLNASGYNINPEDGAWTTSFGINNVFFTRTDNNTENWANYRLRYNDIGIDGWTDKTLIPVKFSFYLNSASASYSWRPIVTVSDMVHQLAGSPWYHDNINLYDVSTWKVRLFPMESLNPQQLSMLKENGFTGHTLNYTSKTVGHSPLYVNMDTIFGSTELTCKDFLTDFTKMLGCIWDFNSEGGLTVMSRNKFFENYQVKDWTHKLDRSNITIKPLAFDKRTYTMSYKSGSSMLEENFKAETGKEYGMQYIDTGYPFNDDKESLLETKFLNTVQSKGQRKCLYRNSNGNLVYVDQTPYELPMIEKKDNGSPNEGFRLVFNNGMTVLPKDEHVYISQDSSFMYNEDIGDKCWMDTNNGMTVPAIMINLVQCGSIPFFSTRNNTASWDFAKPQISYSDESDLSYPGTICLYPRFWSNYMNALYNAKVRVMTANFWLDIEDLITFSFKDFVMIDNHLWHVNKLIDFDLSGDHMTKAELIEVLDPQAWINGQNWSFDSGGMEREYIINTNYVDAGTLDYVIPGGSHAQNEETEE